MGFLTVWKSKRRQELKERILKNREGVLDAMAENIKGARQCPLLLGQKCIGGLCELFQEYKNINAKTGREVVYHNCVFVQMPEMQIELLQNIRKTNQLLDAILRVFVRVETEEKK